MMMTKGYYIIRGKKALFYGATLGLLLLLALRSGPAISAVREALVLCYQTVIPSLFPFFVLSGLLISGGFAGLCARWLSPVMRPLFRVGGAGALALVIGLISGYPMGAKITAELYRNGQISRREAERLLPCCNNSGPLFIIGAVGTGMLGSAEDGLLLYGVHAVCALLVGLCFRFYRGDRRETSPLRGGMPAASRQPEPGRRSATGGQTSLLQAFSASVSGSVSTLLQVCGFILLFAAAIACAAPVLYRLLPPAAVLWIKCLSEVTNGAYLLSRAGLPRRLTLTCLAFCIGTGGLCVMMQAAGLLSGSGISLKTYAAGKLLHGVLSAAVMFCLYPLTERAGQPVFAPLSAPACSVPVLSGVSLLCNGAALVLCLWLCIRRTNKKK
ncbi:MAG: nucleoside recognition domain-containing protein [Clostridia bacterium]